MKKLFFIASVLSWSIVSFGQTKTVVPSSVEIFGDEAIRNYQYLVEKGKLIEEDFFTSKRSFSNVHELVLYADGMTNGNSGISNQEVQSVEKLINTVSQSSGNYTALINDLEFSQELKDITSSILDRVRGLEDGSKLDDLLLSYAKQQKTFNLSASEKEKLKDFIVAMNANFEVIINSNLIKKKMTDLYGNWGDSVIGRRSFLGAVWDIIKCILGTVGSTILGGLAGGGTGTVTLPVIGTISGATLGAVAGASAGVASFC